jgi:hypothetical protein
MNNTIDYIFGKLGKTERLIIKHGKSIKRQNGFNQSVILVALAGLLYVAANEMEKKVLQREVYELYLKVLRNENNKEQKECND